MQWGVPTRLEPTDQPTGVEGYLGDVPAGDFRDPDYERFERQAFLVRMRSDRPALRVHYHPVDQFQVFCWGAAEFANHRVAAGTVHYADRLTPYGPLQPIDEGVSFLTLRSESACGAHYMPDRRSELAERLRADPRPADRRRNVSFDLVAEPDAATAVTTLREDDDGLRVSRVRLAAGESGPEMEIGGDGAFVVVVEGDVDVDGDAPAGVGCVAWNDPGTLAPIVGGPFGAVVAVLQLPDRP